MPAKRRSTRRAGADAQADRARDVAEILADYWQLVLADELAVTGAPTDADMTPSPYKYGSRGAPPFRIPSGFDPSRLKEPSRAFAEDAHAASDPLITKAVDGDVSAIEGVVDIAIRYNAAVDRVAKKHPVLIRAIFRRRMLLPVNLDGTLPPRLCATLVKAGKLPAWFVKLQLGAKTHRKPARPGKASRRSDTLVNVIAEAEGREIMLFRLAGYYRDLPILDGAEVAALAWWKVAKARFLERHNNHPEQKPVLAALGESHAEKTAVLKFNAKTRDANIRARIVERVKIAFLKIFGAVDQR